MAKGGQKTCLFCGSDLHDRRSREHVIPRWLAGELKIGDFPITPTHSTTTGRVKSRRKHTVSSLVLGSVCAGCNNGWMSALEGAAKAPLRRLIKEEVSLPAMAESDRAVIARWAVKTACALNWCSNFHRLVPPTHLHHLARDQESLPPGVHVLGTTRYEQDSFSWVQNQNTIVVMEDDDTERKARASKSHYKIGLQFGALWLGVFFWPLPHWRVQLISGLHSPVWPTAEDLYVWESDVHGWCEQF